MNVIPDGAVLVRDGVLVEVGPTRRVENLADARNAVEINAAGRVVMPGFVDSHTHLAFPGPGANGDAAAAARAVCAGTGKRLAMRSLAYLQAMARHGTTTVEVKSGCGPDESAETKILRMLRALKDDPLDIVPTFLFRLPDGDAGGRVIEWVTEWVARDLLPKLAKRGLARFVDVAWDPDPARQACLRRCLEAARALSFDCKVHADRGSAAAAIAAASDQRALTIDHLEHATSVDVRRLADSGAIATLLPCASFHTGRGNAPARALIAAGAPIALASDFNSQHAPTLNMQTVAALACLRMGLTPAEALTAATINGAHAAGCADRVGSLELGKSADLVILNLPDYREIANNFGTNLVHLTMKRGAVIYKEGRVTVQHSRDEFLNAPPESDALDDDLQPV